MTVLSTLAHELGLEHLKAAHSRRDLTLLLLSRFIRLLGFGSFAPVLILFLRSLNIPDERVGLFLSATLAGDVLVSLLVTWTADVLGRRRMMAVGSLLMAGSGLAFYYSSNYLVLLCAAIVGIISPSGNETGPFSALEQASLAQLTDPDGRVYVLMWHQVLGFLGISLGNALTGFVVSSAERSGKTGSDSYRNVFLAYAIIAGVKIILSFLLTRTVEVDYSPPIQADDNTVPLLQDEESEAESEIRLPPPAPAPTPLPIGRLVALCLLFGLDAFASSLAPLSFVSYFFRTAFNAPISLITSLFTATSIIGCISQLAAGSISKRLGPILTMVGTHMPAQIFTIALAFAPTLPLALTLFVLRASIVSMDSSVRGAFLAAVIPKESRTRFLGIINICKTLASVPGPTLSLSLSALGGMRWSFVITGGLKLIYDYALWIVFKTAKLEH